jgi:hypothetical protein
LGDVRGWKLSLKTSFTVDETIYPQKKGLTPGDHLPFRVLDGDGSLVNMTIPGVQQMPLESTGYGVSSFNTLTRYLRLIHTGSSS